MVPPLRRGDGEVARLWSARCGEGTVAWAAAGGRCDSLPRRNGGG